MVGMLMEEGKEVQVVFDHAEKSNTLNGTNLVQNALDKTTLLVGHNIAYDLVWLWESGFSYNGKVFDTMLGEYVLQRGIKEPLSLEACAERYRLETRKQDTLKEYLKRGILLGIFPLMNCLVTYLLTYMLLNSYMIKYVVV